jgi:hypothetical protein
MTRLKAEGEELVECDGCSRIERMDRPTRNWIEIDPFQFGPLGGGPVEDVLGDRVRISACSIACLRRAFNKVITRNLTNRMRARP